MIRARTDCRLCNAEVRKVLSLTPTPPANSFPTTPNTGTCIPLGLMECVSCGHVQGEYVVSGDELYSDYKYVTPQAMQSHWKKYAQKLKSRYPRAKNVLEIGCNKGGMLDELKSRYPTVWGVDPSATGENAFPWFFNEQTAKALRSQFGKFDLIVANNVFAHIDDLQSVFRGIEWLLEKDGALVFEVQYLPDLVKACAFDTIYHEHHDYHKVGPLQRFVRKYGLEIKRVEKFPVHGGSMRVHARRAPQSSRVFNERVDWTSFAKQIEAMRHSTRQALHGKRVKMFGAPAKATTLIHHFGLQDHIEYAVDSTPEKHERYIPGTSIKIFPEEVIRQSKSTVEMFLAAWNYADVIQKKYPDMRFIVPGGFDMNVRMAA